MAGCRKQHGGENLAQRRLARTIGPEQAVDFTGRNGEIYAFKSYHIVGLAPALEHPA